MNNSILSPSAQKVADTLSNMNISSQVLELSDSTRTAAEAAQAVGCSIGQIVKSLIFKGKDSGSPVLILVSGSNRVDTALISQILNEPILRADPDFVREHTGFAIGGVPPLGFPKPITTLIDQDLLQFDLVWAAAGTPHAVFSINPEDLVKAAGGQIVHVSE
jgi:prolyl-tRNA editing enzyme YbaK/EbsC (Cys-tRNA(Pro) deacylase)